MKSLPLLTFVLTACATLANAGEPFQPTSDDALLLTLPAATQAASTRALRRAAREAPESLPSALALAEHHLALAMRGPSPRDLGYAQAALARWWTLDDPPLPVRRVRALVAQHVHDFDTALDNLDAIITRRPRDIAALLTRAGVHEARGDYDFATADCQRLARAGARLQSVVCGASIASLSGGPMEAAAAARTLRRAVQRAGASLDAAQRQWALTVLAEVAARGQMPQFARRVYTEALATGERSPYLLASFADFALAQDDAAFVLELLADETRTDALLARRVLAQHALMELVPSGAGGDARLFAQRIRALRLRGDESHKLEQARVVLAVDGDVSRALALALESWENERSPGAARFILDAAQLAGEPGTAAGVRRWLDQTQRPQRFPLATSRRESMQAIVTTRSAA